MSRCQYRSVPARSAGYGFPYCADCVGEIWTAIEGEKRVCEWSAKVDQENRVDGEECVLDEVGQGTETQKGVKAGLP